MAPDATTDDVRRAYLRLAMEHHPDRALDGSDEDRRRADERMAEVNAAWEVLGDEGRRLGYDRSLLAAGATSSVEDPFAHLLRRQRPIDDVEPGVDPDATRPPALVRALPLVVVLGVLLAIVVFTAYAGGPGSEPDGQEAVRTAEEIPVGTCITLPPDGSTVVVACGTRSDGTVAAIAPWPQPCPVPLVAVPVPERQESLCLRS